jgi:methylamine dehydrogenase heavy chain
MPKSFARARSTVRAVACLLISIPVSAGAEPPIETGGVATMPPIGEHTVWVTDIVLSHSLLFDGDTGEVVATIDAGTTISPKPPLLSRERGEIYSVEIDYARGRRGTRTDYVTIYDDQTLEVTDEVVLPTRTSESAASLGYAALLDGSRFLATFNQFPTTSVSIVDLEARAFVEEIVVAGCAGIYPTGPSSFAMLCGDGTMLVVTLGPDGRKQSTVATARFFDAVAEPVMMAGGRSGSRWYFVSFLGTAHEIDFGQTPVATSSWQLSSDAERSAGWRPGGRQLVALHRATGHLFVIFHRGESGSHKSPGPEVWVHDVSKRERIARFEMPNFTAAFLGGMLELEPDGMGDWLLENMLPDDGADTITVSQDAAPLLFTRNSGLGTVAVLDARTGEHLRDLSEVGLAGMRLEVP